MRWFAPWESSRRRREVSLKNDESRSALANLILRQRADAADHFRIATFLRHQWRLFDDRLPARAVFEAAVVGANPLHVIHRLAVRRNAIAISRDSVLARVVTGQRQLDIAVEGIEQEPLVLYGAIDILA